MVRENIPLISIIIPCRNEEQFIGICLDSIAANDYPKDQLEVLVVDGMSVDGTRGILKRYAEQYPFIKFLENPKKTTPVAMNIGIKSASGEIIMKMDAHTTYEKDYISKCVRFLQEYNADNVGGILKTVPGGDSTIAQGIAFALSHPFGSGNSYFRVGSREPRWVDTVSFGCYRKEVLEKVGLYNERLTRSQDIDLNIRLKRSGGNTLLHPEIIGYYYAKPNIREFLKHNWNNGIWAILPFLYSKGIPVSSRHLVPLAFVVSMVLSGILGLFVTFFLWLSLGITAAYAFSNLAASSQIACRERDFRYLIVMPLVFVVLHVSYGLGSLWGSIKVLAAPGFWKKLLAHNRVRT